ncbi:MAG: hypothetical protein GXP01_11285 [Alphaproteobacteria bacterium]|nr:hypothetical protein [Alphaproteobacteria bacterium]
MKKLLLITVSVGIIATATAAKADQVFSCIDENTSVHFVLYEDGSGTRGGNMYINNIQVAVLDTYRVNDISVRGTIVGNTADTEFVFNSSREKVYVELSGTSEVVCSASVRSD